MAGAVLKTMAKDTLNDIIGNNEKALLIISDKRTGGALPNVDKQGILDKTLSGAKNLLGKGNVAQGSDKALRVQFNPSEVEFFATTDPIEYQAAQNADPAIGASADSSNPKVLMSVKLYFDAMNISDAFMSGTTLASALGTASSIGQKVAAKVKGGTAFTVRPAVMGLLAALMNPKTRYVTFKWARFEFAGIIEKMNVEFMMFSPSGEPIRACVDIDIEQEYSEKEDNSMFSAAFDRVFGGADIASITKKSTLSKVLNSNILNLNI